MRVLGVPQQPRVVVGCECGHPTVPERSLEVVFVTAAYFVHLVHEEHAASVAKIAVIPDDFRVTSSPVPPAGA